MLTINGEIFYDEPNSCGTCPFFYNGSTSKFAAKSPKGHCRLFDEMHNSWINTPRRCAKLFKKAFKENNGKDLTIVINEV